MSTVLEELSTWNVPSCARDGSTCPVLLMSAEFGFSDLWEVNAVFRSLLVLPLNRTTFSQIKAGKLTAQGVRNLSVAYTSQKAKTLPDIEKFAGRLVREVDELFRAEKLDEIIKSREHIDDEVRIDAAVKLRLLAERVLKYAEGLWPTTQDASPKMDQQRSIGALFYLSTR